MFYLSRKNCSYIQNRSNSSNPRKPVRSLQVRSPEFTYQAPRCGPGLQPRKSLATAGDLSSWGRQAANELVVWEHPFRSGSCRSRTAGIGKAILRCLANVSTNVKRESRLPFEGSHPKTRQPSSSVYDDVQPHLSILDQPAAWRRFRVLEQG